MSMTTPQEPKLLIVEDSETQALQIRRLLEQNGFRVERVATAEAALESLNKRLPDLVVADYHLPGINGDEMSRQIRLNVRTRALPVLMLTEDQERDRERHGLESGADAYIAKSADQDLIVLRIKALLRQRSLEQPHSLAETDGETAPIFRRARILVVDTSATYRAYLANLLARDGTTVENAAGMPDALHAVSSADWDCIVVNLLGTAFDGIRLCEQLDGLRSGEAPGSEDRYFRIVGLGSDTEGGKTMLARAFNAGVDDLIPVTTDAEVLTVRIRSAVRRKLLQDENRQAELEKRRREVALERARGEAAAAAAKAALAEALARSNAELEDTNRKLRDTHAKLVQAAKMASLGELVAGIAHEINNPLAFILAHQGTVQHLLSEIEAGLAHDPRLAGAAAKSRDRLQAMNLGLKRIQNLVLNLRKFSRMEEEGFQLVDVPEALDTVLALLVHKLGDRIVVERHYRGGGQLFCSPALLNQVVMNIIGNAADAIMGDGRIIIATHSDAQTYSIEIEDSGPGIPPEYRERIFEPFFTTKPVGAGTGLGLAIAYNVVQAHGGTISVGGSSEGGACFLLRIPIRTER